MPQRAGSSTPSRSAASCEDSLTRLTMAALTLSGSATCELLLDSPVVGCGDRNGEHLAGGEGGEHVDHVGDEVERDVAGDTVRQVRRPSRGSTTPVPQVEASGPRLPPAQRLPVRGVDEVRLVEIARIEHHGVVHRDTEQRLHAILDHGGAGVGRPWIETAVTGCRTGRGRSANHRRGSRSVALEGAGSR